jgi:hypothetical protein
MPVYWTIQAHRHLRQALAEELSREVGGGRPGTPGGPGASTDSCSGVLERTMSFLDAMLNEAFGGAVVVVKDQVIGYRRKKGRFTLLVEAFGPEDSPGSGPFVVKIGPKDKLDQEIAGWKCCRPPGLKHDLVFLSLDQKPSRELDGEIWSCLVYGDAQQFLGVTVTVPFEDAALECVRSGFPRLLSIAFVINELYERIGHLFYSQAFVDDPAPVDPEPDAKPYVLDVPHLDDALGRWDTEPACMAARREVNTLPESGAEKFLDPVNYLRYVQDYVPHLVEIDKKAEVRPPTAAKVEPLAGLQLPTIADLVPRMLRGCAHGDLHGRNILVGIVRDQAMWPTVFDYEDMGPRNLIGWDFVKLETELKIRAYTSVFSGKETTPFAREVQKFESDLNRRTEDCYLGTTWPDVGNPKMDTERLVMVLLSIRRMAAQHLGINHGRPNEWLEEYYFLLTCYGVATGRFPNLQPRERIGALISAGVAASRLSWPRTVQKDKLVRP